MPSRATCRIADHPSRITAQRAAVADIEARLWSGGFDEALLERYQSAFRELEHLIAESGDDRRHSFVIVIAVADRPQQLRACLDSLLELCRAFAYGGQAHGRWRKVRVLVADDSSQPGNIAQDQELARHFSAEGLETLWLGAEEQIARIGALGPDAWRQLAWMIGAHGDKPAGGFGHKGQAAMRNIAALKLADMAAAGDRLLFHAVDSDQEFKVKVASPAGDRNVCALNFFYWLDEIFSATNALVLTGKVVGDPPVSPAVMMTNFLEDVLGFLSEEAAGDGGAPCPHHRNEVRREGEAAYHDMADLFGFRSAREAYRYACPLPGAHTRADCFAQFGSRLNGFFYGEHPTRVSRYVHEPAMASVRAARTVYVGNYVCRPAALEYFVPFAPLRLRMSGPTLGRIIQAEIGARFVSANLPMLHKRTLEDDARSEFRPGIEQSAQAVDLSGEFERQFYGDVMLFSVERLAACGFPERMPTTEAIAVTVDAVRGEMLGKYLAKRDDIAGKLAAVTALLRAPEQWWNRDSGNAEAVACFERFIDNVARNFGTDAKGYARIGGEGDWVRWRVALIDAISRYPQDRRAWRQALAAAARPTSMA